MTPDWFDVVRSGNAWHGPEEFAAPRAHTVSLWQRIVRRVRAFMLWGRR